MGYKEVINELKPIDYSKYKDITSYEKLMIFTAKKIEEKGVPLTFNYLCVSAFKMFPDVFCCDEEFKEFPSIDRLNRTLMHLKYVKTGKSYLAGSTKSGYSITKYGYMIAEEVEKIIGYTEVNENIAKPIIDKHKKGVGDYYEFISGNGYKKYLETGQVDDMYVWSFYKVTPYTQLKSTIKNLKDVLAYAKEKNDEMCIKYIEKIVEIIK
ncbi:MAG: hypothetical protein IJ220_04655 [Clostridia bacterium]|nr:hypothetical protein [Clostridia bacterium]